MAFQSCTRSLNACSYFVHCLFIMENVRLNFQVKIRNPHGIREKLISQSQFLIDPPSRTIFSSIKQNYLIFELTVKYSSNKTTKQKNKITYFCLNLHVYILVIHWYATRVTYFIGMLYICAFSRVVVPR